MTTLPPVTYSRDGTGNFLLYFNFYFTLTLLYFNFTLTLLDFNFTLL